MVAHTPKWGLAVEEPGDPSDMPTASGRLAQTIEAALDRLQTTLNNYLNTNLAAKVSKTGDHMTGQLLTPELRITSRWSISNFTRGYSIHRMSPDGTQIIDVPFAIDLGTGQVLSNSHIGGVFTGDTNANGQFTIPLPTSPTGRWAVTATPTSNALIELSATVRAVTATSVKLRVVRHNTTYAGGVLPHEEHANQTVTVHWTAVAY